MSTNHPMPSIETHVPLVDELPPEGAELATDRDPLPVPSLWQQSVRVKHKVTGKVAVVARIDHGMNMFRPYYPDTKTFAPRTHWEHCKDWDVEVTFSPKELARRAATEQLEQELAKLDADAMAAFVALVDEDDPAKALGKLEALRRLGVIKADVLPEPAAESPKKRGAR